LKKCSSLQQRWRCSCKFKSRRIGSGRNFGPGGLGPSVRPSVFHNSRECSLLVVKEGLNIPLYRAIFSGLWAIFSQKHPIIFLSFEKLDPLVSSGRKREWEPPGPKLRGGVGWPAVPVGWVPHQDGHHDPEVGHRQDHRLHR
jgi:hypothetical protein